MSVVRGLSVAELKKRGSIKDTDVSRLRRTLFEWGPLTREEAEGLFAINAGCRIKDTAWTEVFVEAIADFIVNREAPEGYLTAANCSWLIDRVSSARRIRTTGELELLVCVLEKARWAPESLCLFALEQIHQAVVCGDGPVRGAQSIGPGRIIDAEVQLVRRILIAFASDGRIAITRREAEILFAIEEALGEENAAWTDLFARGITNALMSATGYRVPTRTEALASGVAAAEHDAPAIEGGRVRASLAGVWSAYREQSREERAIELLERRRVEIITSEDILPMDVEWLASRLIDDGRLTVNEAALVQYLKGESGRVGAGLETLVGLIGVAA